MKMIRGMAAAVVAGGGIVAGTAPAGAITPETSGWWHKARQVAGAPALPASLPVLPDRGLYVGNDPSGPFAISAVRYQATTPARLVLKVNTQNQNAGTPALLACPTTGVWESANGGQWPARPAYDCKVKSVGKVATDGKSVTFDLPAAITMGAGEGASVSVAIVPDASAAPFSLAFEAPGEDSFSASAASDTSSSPSAPFETNDGAPAADGGLTLGESDRGLVPTGDGGFVAAPSAPAGPAASLPSPADSVAGPVSRQVARVVEDRTDRMLALGVLAGIFGLLWWFGSRPVRAPRLLGSLTSGGQLALPEPEVRGIGRFARPRTTARP